MQYRTSARVYVMKLARARTCSNLQADRLRQRLLVKSFVTFWRVP